MEDQAYRTAAHRLMLQEQAPTLRVTGVDLGQYADRLIERYSNPSLKHRTWQIAMDGTQKLPQRMLDPFVGILLTVALSHAWRWVWRVGCVMSAA